LNAVAATPLLSNRQAPSLPLSSPIARHLLAAAAGGGGSCPTPLKVSGGTACRAVSVRSTAYVGRQPCHVSLVSLPTLQQGTFASTIWTFRSWQSLLIIFLGQDSSLKSCQVISHLDSKHLAFPFGSRCRTLCQDPACTVVPDGVHEVAATPALIMPLIRRRVTLSARRRVDNLIKFPFHMSGRKPPFLDGAHSHLRPSLIQPCPVPRLAPNGDGPADASAVRCRDRVRRRPWHFHIEVYCLRFLPGFS
jgi:hypothetical protein